MGLKHVPTKRAALPVLSQLCRDAGTLSCGRVDGLALVEPVHHQMDGGCVCVCLGCFSQVRV